MAKRTSFADIMAQQKQSSRQFMERNLNNSLATPFDRIGSAEISQYLSDTDQNRDEVVKHFKEKYGENTGINRADELSTHPSQDTSVSNAIFTEMSGSYNFAKDYFYYTGESLISNISNIKNQAQEVFYNNFISSSLIKEEKTVKKFSKAFPFINYKSDVLNFLNANRNTNNTYNINNDIQKMRNTLINNYSNIFEDTGTKDKEGNYIDITQNFDQDKLNKASNNMNSYFKNMFKELESGVIDTEQFIGYYLLITGKLNKILKDNGLGNIITGMGVSQLDKAATTAFELPERMNLGLYLSAQTKMPIKVIGTGSMMTDDFNKIINKKKNGRKSLTFKEIEDAYIELIRKKVDKGDFSGTLTGLAAIPGYWAGSETSMGTDDLAIEIGSGENKDTILIDAKLGKYKRYIGGISSFQDDKSLQISTLTLEQNTYISAPEVREQINIALSLFILNIIAGNISEDFYRSIQDILTYALLGSKVFIDKFRKGLDIDKQADLLVTKNEYVWFSDVFITFYNDYFLKSKMAEKITVKKHSQLSQQMANILIDYQQNNKIIDFLNQLKQDQVLLDKTIDIYDIAYSTSLSFSLTRQLI